MINEYLLIRPEEFASSPLPKHIITYVGPDCSFDDLTLELAAAKSGALPSPAIGTRVAFRLMCPDLRNTSTAPYPQPHFAVKELGSVVIGAGGPGVEEAGDKMTTNNGKGKKTLADIKFVVGDYISCAVFPPLEDGSIVSPTAAKGDSVSGPRPPAGVGYQGGFPPRESGAGRGASRRKDRASEVPFPIGEWRRGEKVPNNHRWRGQGRVR